MHSQKTRSYADRDCSIDQTSSAELSEAINSMFRWYKNACVCYAYLSEVINSEDGFLMVSDGQALLSFRLLPSYSRWFSRGWTLQELLAPNVIEFYAADWSEIGTKASLSQTISEIIGIGLSILRG